MVASTIPNCRAHDPPFAGELAVIFDHGARQMFEVGEDVFYYITAMNENYAQPSLPSDAAAGVIKGMYRFCISGDPGAVPAIRLLGSGAILREVIAAAELLANEWNVAAEVWSVTSFTELAREARETVRTNRLHPEAAPLVSYVAQCLPGRAPIVAATDYVSAYTGLIASYIPAPFVSLGTDGFGRSDTRSALRRFFEVDRHHIVLTALHGLAGQGKLTPTAVSEAIERYGLDSDAMPPWTR